MYEEICRGIFSRGVFILGKMNDLYSLWVGDDFSNPETDGYSVCGTLSQIIAELLEGDYMNVGLNEQYAQLEMDESWDEYLTSCLTLGIPTLPYSEWKKYYK